MVPDAHSNPTLECHRGNGILFAIIRPSLYQHINNELSLGISDLRLPVYCTFAQIYYSVNLLFPARLDQDGQATTTIPPP